MKRISLLAIASLAAVAASAQYPTIPDSVKVRAAATQAEWDAHSDAAWEAALPIVKQEEAEKGRPYRPWASKPEDLIRADIKAFPGAEGGGAYTPGGRDGKVYVVTSLDDSGPGTLREACEAGGARIVVFNVAGVIDLKSPINVRAPYITILGQTAPGDGICVTGNSFLIDTHDVVMRHLRFRRGATDVAFRDDALGGNAVGNIILDHISSSWGLDENMSVYRHVYNRDSTGKGEKLPTVNITIQNSIFSEALDKYNHAFGATIGGHNSTFARNLFASNISRNCSIGMDEDFNFINNVTYNWWNRSVDGGDNTSRLNIINNNFKPGPITETNAPDAPIRYRIVKMEAGRDKSKKDHFGKAYVDGNIVWGNEKVTMNNWDGGVQIYNGPVPEERISELKVDKPFPMAEVTIMEAYPAFEYVMENAGATRPARDAVDERVIKTVITGEAIYAPDADKVEANSPYVKRRLPADSYKYGIITDPAQVGGLPEYKGTPRVDTDGDGLPDSWEMIHRLNPHDPTDSAKIGPDGYAWIEVYANELAE